MGIRPKLLLCIGIDDFAPGDRFDETTYLRVMEDDVFDIPLGFMEQEHPELQEKRFLHDYIVHDTEYGDPQIFAIRAPGSQTIGPEIPLYALAQYLGCNTNWHYVFQPVQWGKDGYWPHEVAEWQAEHQGRFGNGAGIDRHYDLLEYPYLCESVMQWATKVLNYVGFHVSIEDLKVMLYLYWC